MEKVDIDGSKVDRIFGGIDGSEVDRILVEDGGVVVEEDCRIGGLHMDIMLDIDCRQTSHELFIDRATRSVIDNAVVFILLCQHIVETIAQTDHSVKAAFRKANQIDAYYHNNARFEISATTTTTTTSDNSTNR